MKTKTKYQSLVIISLLALSLLASFQVSSGTNPVGFIQTPAGLSSVQVYSNLDITEFGLSSGKLLELKSLIGVYEEGKNYNPIIDGHGTGLIPPTEDEWMKIAQNIPIVRRLTAYQDLPSSVDLSLTPWFPPIGDQARQGSCAAWAVGYYTKTFQEAKEHSWNFSEAKWVEGQPSPSYQDKIISPSFIYNLLNGGADNGLWFEEPIQLICSVGAASWQSMPYTDKNCTAWPSEAAWTEAAYYRGDSSGYKFIDVDSPEGLTNLKNLIVSGNLAITAVDAYKYRNFTDNDVLVADKYVDIELNHATTIVGYDDNISYIENGQIRQGAFKAANSWGVDEVDSNTTKWENVLDGFYWISYETMKQQVGWCIYYEDLIDYQPSLLAKFQIEHLLRGEVSITVGLGTPTLPLATKVFSEYKTYSDSKTGCVFGGNTPFCPNKIVLDVTELASYASGLYHQPFFLKVHDAGTPATGNVTYFSIQNSGCTTTPAETKQYENVYLTVNHSLVPPSLTASPAAGSPLNSVTLNGVGFTPGGSVNLTYLNPINSTWMPIVDNLNLTESHNFTYEFDTPDLMQSNLPGDNAPLFDEIVFRAQDNADGYVCNATGNYVQWRRGLTQIGNACAAGLYGNGTDLASSVFVQAGQQFVITGQRFSPGSAILLWDSFTNLGTVVVDETGIFNATVTVPAAVAGKHSVTIRNAGYDFCINLSRLPQISNNYAELWRTSDFNINLSPELEGIETFYRINDGAVCSVSANGQPKITDESSNNTLEYWGAWNIYGTGTLDLSRYCLTGIKLDKTPPTGSITASNARTNMTTVTLALSATDTISGIAQMRFSNDNATWSNWEPYATSRTWDLQSGDGQKTITVQYKDNAGLISTYNCAVLLDTIVQPTASPNPTTTATAISSTLESNPTAMPSPTASPETPELTVQLALILLALSTITLAVLYKSKRKSK